MNTSSPDPFAPEPLTPEERETAMRLARTGPHGEPSPALDARIIGAAHAATGSSRSATRWPALIGLAATLALAVGVTWQLKPVGEPAVDGTVQETASAPAAESVAEVMPVPADMARQQHAPTDPPPAPVPQASGDAAPKRAAPRTSVAPAPAAPSVATPSTSDNGGPIMPATEEGAALRAERKTLSRSTQADDARPRAMPPQIDSPTATAAGPDAFPADMARMAEPAEMVPAIQDRGLEPRDWIERIRLRRDSGDLTGARESLQLLRRDHPQTLVPPDLVQLADAPP